MYPVNWHDTSHIGIYGWVDRRMDVRTDVHDVMAIKPNFLASMGYQYFLNYGAPRARGAPLLPFVVYGYFFLAYGTPARSARGSQNRAILSIICPFTGNRAFRFLSIYPVERTLPKCLFAKSVQLNTLSLWFCRLLTLDSKIPALIRLRIVRKSTNNSHSTTAYVQILLSDNPSLLTKKMPQNVLNGFLALY